MKVLEMIKKFWNFGTVQRRKAVRITLGEVFLKVEVAQGDLVSIIEEKKAHMDRLDAEVKALVNEKKEVDLDVCRLENIYSKFNELIYYFY